MNALGDDVSANILHYISRKGGGERGGPPREIAGLYQHVYVKLQEGP